MSHIRKRINPTKDVKFMITDWTSYNANHSEFPYSDHKDNLRRYLVKLFGVTKDGKSVAVTVKNYEPYFYVKLPDNLKNLSILEKALKDAGGNISKVTKVQKYDFKWFSNFKLFDFAKIKVQSSYAFKSLTRLLEGTPINIPGLGKIKLQLYFSNIDPLIKFMHDKELKGSSWIKIKRSRYETADDPELSNTQIDIVCDQADITPLDINQVAPLRQASWDIECDSSHGDFPVAIKDFSKPTREILENYCNIIFNKTEINENIILNWFKVMFDKFRKEKDFEKVAVSGISKVYTKDNLKPKQSDVETIAHEVMKILKKSEIEIQEIDNKKVLKFENRKSILKILNSVLTKRFMELGIESAGDKIIQIGTVVQEFGSKGELVSWIGTVGTCDPIDGSIVASYKTEAELIRGWADFIKDLDPEILVGYNTHGFDWEFIVKRAEELGVEELFETSRNTTERAFYKEQRLSSSALGNNILKIFFQPGRISIDLYKVFQGDPTNKLDSYKLDYVGEKFLGENKDDVSPQEIFKLQKGSSTDRCVIARYCLQDCRLVLKLLNKKKIIVNNIGMSNVCLVPLSYLFLRGQGVKIFSLVSNECNNQGYLIPLIRPADRGPSKSSKGPAIDKGDLEPIEIDSEIHYLRSSDLAELRNKYKGENIISAVKKFILKEEVEIDIEATEEPEADAENSNENGEESYEGAIVLEPEPGLYLEDPVTVADYNSLYPSSMIEKNISHDSIISIRTHKDDGTIVNQEGQYELEKQIDAGELPGYTIADVKYDNYKQITEIGKNGKPKKTKTKEKDGYVVCRYVQFPDGKKGILPTILQKLLKARKDTRLKAEFKDITLKDSTVHTGLALNLKETSAPLKVKIIEFAEPKNIETVITIDRNEIDSIVDTYDDFEKAVLDSLQLAYKVVANSLYGQVGAGTSPICWKPLAASTTATGRDRLIFSKNYIEGKYQNVKNYKLVWDVEYYRKELFRNPGIDLSKYEIRKITIQESKIVYGDTDSIFVKIIILDEDGNKITGHDAVGYCMRLMLIWAFEISSQLGKPQNIAFEKCIWPFMLFGKKQYQGHYHENIEDLNDYHEKSMGVAWKKRNYAQIVAEVCNAVIEHIFTHKDAEGAKSVAIKLVDKLISGGYPMDNFIITKTLKDRIEYANPDGVAHRVLADRIGERDPGNKPQSNDRIPFCYVVTNDRDPKTGKKLNLKQGDIIEHPEYIKENKLSIDYKFYLTNQLMNPLCTIFGLVMDRPEKLFEKYIPLKLTKEEKEELKKKLADDAEKNPIRIPAKKKKVKSEEEMPRISEDVAIKAAEMAVIPSGKDVKKPTMKNTLEEIQKYALANKIGIVDAKGKKKTKAALIAEIN